ncbi:MAG: hypothetical protein GX575_25435 [Candidatus Anammoximicrobium sp.]|nr:hypothetical protein [Candidatus Anammoximicrobium sp.]
MRKKIQPATPTSKNLLNRLLDNGSGSQPTCENQWEKTVARDACPSFSQAIRDLERAVELHSVDGTPLDWLFLAMANCQSGRIEEACRWMERTRRWLAQPGRELSWIERIEYDCLFREARELAESVQAAPAFVPP